MKSLMDRIKHLSKRMKTILAVVAVLVLVILVGGGLVLTNAGVRQSVLGLTGNLSGAAVTATYADQALVHTCYRGTGGSVMHLWYDNGWKEETMTPANWQTDVAPACVAWGPHEIDMFAKGLDDKMYHRSWNGSAWSGWGALGTPSGVTIDGAPAAVSRGPGHSEVFVRGSDNHVWNRSYSDTSPNDHVRNGTWSNWGNLGLDTYDDVAAVSREADRLEVFARGTNNKLYHKAWDGGWGDWTGFDDSTNMASAPTVASRFPDHMQVYWKNSSNQVMVKQYLNGSWQSSGVESQFTVRPSLVSNGTDRFDFFWRDSGNVLHHKWWIAGSGWGSDENLGISVGSIPSVATSNRGVEWQLQGMPDHGGKALRGVYAKDASGNYIGDDPIKCKHYQSVQRQRGTDGTNYLILARSGNHTDACKDEPDDPGELLVFKMTSRGTTAGPFGSNSANSSTAYQQDQTVLSMHFDGQSHNVCGQTQTWKKYWHPGGTALVDNVLIIGMQEPQAGNTNALLLLDVTNPTCPKILKWLGLADYLGSPWTESPGVGILGVVKQASGKYLFALKTGRHDVAFLETTTTSLTDSALQLTYLDNWHDTELAGGEGQWCWDCRWGDVAGLRTLVDPTLDWQMLNFVKDPVSGAFYLIGASNSTTITTNGEDHLRAYRVTRSGNAFSLQLVGSRHLYLGDSGGMGDLDAAAGIYITPEGWMVLYTGDHDNEGVSYNGRETLEMGEFSAYSGVQ